MSSTEDIQPYIEKMKEIVDKSTHFNLGAPGELLEYLYIGNHSQATDIPLLQSLGITHIVNCAAGEIKTGQDFYGAEFQYLGLEACDDEEYDVMQHFDVTWDFIESARALNGKVLIHCAMGVNRSGALAVSYIMKHTHQGPLHVVRSIKPKRGIILENRGFQEQVIRQAKSLGLLELDKDLLNE